MMGEGLVTWYINGLNKNMLNLQTAASFERAVTHEPMCARVTV